MKNKYLLFVLGMIFLIGFMGFVSSAEWDNIKKYNETDRSIIVKNSFLGIFGVNEVAKVIPLTPHINYVMRGKDRVVAEFKIENYEDYNNVFKEMIFYDINNDMNKFQREFKYEYGVIIGTEQKPIYETTCNNIATFRNGTRIKDCQNTLSHYEMINIIEWKEINPSQSQSLPKGNYHIRIITDVLPNDNVEFIPTWFGVRMPEYAVWIDDFNSQLVFYYKLDETAGTVVPDSRSNYTGATLNMEDADWIAGKINNALDFDMITNESVNTTFASFVSVYQNISFAFWFYTNESTDYANPRYMMGAWDYGGTDEIIGVYQDDNMTACQFRGKDLVMRTATSSNKTGNNQWHHVACVRDTASNKIYIYLDGIEEANTGIANISQEIDLTGTHIWLGSRNNNLYTEDFLNVSIDEFGWWNRTLSATEVSNLYNAGAGISFSNSTPTITLNSPINATNSINSTIIFNGSVVSGVNISNVSLIIDDTINQTNSSGLNNSQYIFTNTLTTGLHTWNYQACNIENRCVNGTEREINISIWVQNITTYNTNTFETAEENFTMNITTNGTAPTSARFIYNSNPYGVTITNTAGNNYNLSSTIQIPANTGNQSFYFDFYIGLTQYTTTTQNQTVSLAIFTLCNSTYSTPYLNFSFKDEVTTNYINASIPTADFVYYLGNGTTNKTYNFINNTEHQNWTLCASPTNRTFNVDIIMQYKANGYPQRIYNPSVLSFTNVTTNKTLWLLPTASGGYVTYQVTNVAGQILENVFVNVTRIISGMTEVVGVGYTGGDGRITFWVNPDYLHTLNFSKSGYAPYIFSHYPTDFTNPYTIILGSTGTATTFYELSRGITSTITPTNATLVNGTYYNFSLTLISSYWTVTLFGFNVSNSSGILLGQTNSTANGGVLWLNLSTGVNDTEIYLNYFWEVNGTFKLFSRHWYITNSAGTDWSLLVFFSDLKTYSSQGMFGLDNFGLAIIIFLTIFIFTGIVSYKFGITNPAAISVLLFFLVFVADVGLGLFNNIVKSKAMAHFPMIFIGAISILLFIREAQK